MGNPFQDQFLKLGLVDKKQVNKSKKKQYQKKKQRAATKQPVVDENALLIQQDQEKKRARDQQLNQEREAKLKKRKQLGSAKQIVEQNKLEKSKNGVAYRFTDNKKIQRVFVSEEIADKLSEGKLAIVRVAQEYEVVPKEAAQRIEALDLNIFTFIAESTTGSDDDPDDPYAEYKVPDDLVW